MTAVREGARGGLWQPILGLEAVCQKYVTTR
jgi:hypothetical protein